MMRLVAVCGIPGSGKTSIIRESCNGVKFSFIANNPESQDMIADISENSDNFPFKSPCARIRQFQFRVDMMKEKNPELLIAEPPGNCLEVSSPMLNQIYVNDKSISLGPLMTVIDGYNIDKEISKRTTEGLRMFNMIDESDVIVISHSDLIDDERRAFIKDEVSKINTDAEVIFCSVVTGEGMDSVKERITGDYSYTRPLWN